MRKSPYLGDKAFVIAGLAGVVACAWAYLIPASLDMYGRMDGAAAWMMEATWDADYLLLIFLMWAAMMVAMMLPSALPTLLIFHKAVRNDPKVRSPSRRMFAFVAGYILAWFGFSVGATLLQWGLAEAALLSPMMVSASPWLGGAILIVAGVYQWTPIKSACLQALPLAAGVSHGALAARHARSAATRAASRCLLRGLLLGTDAPAVRRRRDESAVDRRHHRLRDRGETRAVPRAGRAVEWARVGARRRMGADVGLTFALRV